MRKVVFIIESLQVGGAEKCLTTVLRQLDYKNVDVDLILFSRVGLLIDQVPNSVNIIYLENKKLSLLERALFFLKRKLNTKKMHNAQILWNIVSEKYKVLDKKYDTVIAFNQGFATYFASKYLIGAKKYSWLNTNYLIAGYNIDFDYAIYKYFDCVIAVCTDVEKIFKSVLLERGYNLSTMTIKDFVDKDEIIKKASETPILHFESYKKNIISVGRLAKPKALHLAVKACKILVDRGHLIKWYVVGEGSERQYLENLILQHKITDNFILLGQSKNPYPLINLATIFVQTSIFEGLATSVIEATVLNKPIVSTNFPSIYSIIQDEQTGLVAEMNAESIALKIERLLLDETLQKKFMRNLSNQQNTDKIDSMKKINMLINS